MEDADISSGGTVRTAVAFATHWSLDCFPSLDSHLNQNQPLEILWREREARRELNCRTASERLKIVRAVTVGGGRGRWRLGNQDKFRSRLGLAAGLTDERGRTRTPTGERRAPPRFPLARFHGFHHALLRRRRTTGQSDVCRRRFQACCMFPRLLALPLAESSFPSSLFPFGAGPPLLFSCLSGLTPPPPRRLQEGGEETTLRQRGVYRCNFSALTVK